MPVLRALRMRVSAGGCLEAENAQKLGIQTLQCTEIISMLACGRRTSVRIP